MADDVMGKAAAEAKPVAATGVGSSVAVRPESRAERARRMVYRRRFTFFYIVLATIAGAGVGAFIVLAGRGSPAPAPAWSAWQPTGTAEQRVAQIADHVSKGYRLPSGHSLVAVTYSGPPVGTSDGTSLQAVRAVAVRPDTTGGKADSSDVRTIDGRNTVQFNLCGLGRGCSIPEGKPSVARGQLLRREALELALYSFRYLGGVDSALILLPPRADGKAATSVFIEKKDVRPELGQPVDQTLTAPLTPGVGEITSDEQSEIDRSTLSRIYAYGWLQAQDGSLVLVLTPALSG